MTVGCSIQAATGVHAVGVAAVRERDGHSGVGLQTLHACIGIVGGCGRFSA